LKKLFDDDNIILLQKGFLWLPWTLLKIQNGKDNNK
jgi:hypothetical protein